MSRHNQYSPCQNQTGSITTTFLGEWSSRNLSLIWTSRIAIPKWDFMATKIQGNLAKAKNSKFFHLSTIFHRRRNNIDTIKTEDGSWISKSKLIRQFFLENFKQQFKEEEVHFPTHLEYLILPCVTEDENANLLTTPSPEEIKST